MIDKNLHKPPGDLHTQCGTIAMAPDAPHIQGGQRPPGRCVYYFPNFLSFFMWLSSPLLLPVVNVEHAFCTGPKDRFIFGTVKHAISCGGRRPPQEIACLAVPRINLSFGPAQKACSTLTSGNSKGDETMKRNSVSLCVCCFACFSAGLRKSNLRYLQL